ncbi:MAG: hypothetical protein D6753_15830 [Planctomycetota bacterium]|nr:MAG: hypothetical protein D6753_15830 [Planctomycetota bacterium]
MTRQAADRQPEDGQPAIVGIDIGGANLKIATAGGLARACFFPMWKTPEQLATRLARLIEDCGIDPSHARFALTMTGEMADCFATRRAGVQAILRQVLDLVPGERLFVYRVDGGWCTASAAWEDPWSVAASNWRALAEWILSCDSPVQPPPDLLIDIGSTTTDVIPLFDGRVATTARTDRDRLQSGQLVYIGCQRTLLAALQASVRIDGVSCPLMAEYFADLGDALVVAGLASESSADLATADGRPRTQEFAAARLARMIGEDAETLDLEPIRDLGRQFAQSASARIADAVVRQLDVRQRPPTGTTLMFTGHGDGLHRCVAEELTRRGLAFHAVWLSDSLSPELSRSAPAYACARLLLSRLHGREAPGVSIEGASLIERLEPLVEPRLPTEGRPRPSPRTATKLPDQSRRVIKLGGSLLDVPNLSELFCAWMRAERPACNLLVVGGGPLVDAVRQLDRIHELPPTEIHWLCVRLLDATWELAQWLLPQVVHPVADADSLNHFLSHDQSADRVALVRPGAFYEPDGDRSGLPANWSTTSDSVAAYLAQIVAADELVLLKSTCIYGQQTSAPGGDSAIQRWAEAGLVDAMFPIAARCIPRVRYLNLRSATQATPTNASSPESARRATRS